MSQHTFLAQEPGRDLVFPAMQVLGQPTPPRALCLAGPSRWRCTTGIGMAGKQAGGQKVSRDESSPEGWLDPPLKAGELANGSSGGEGAWVFQGRRGPLPQWLVPAPLP